ncbi:Fc.00g030970.m01.CDS01 [Cosmosporella sp. VM-42]
MPSLTASYTSGISAPFNISHSLTAPPSSSIADKTKYLASLRAAITATQDEVNKELTARMEEDKLRDAKTGVDEAKEEENYGEEVVEEED